MSLAMENKKITGGIGITAGEDVVFGDISGQVVIGGNITQVQAIDNKREKLEGYLIEHSKHLVEVIKNWPDHSSGSRSKNFVHESILLQVDATYKPHTRIEIKETNFLPKYGELVIEHLISGYTNNVDTWLECKNIIRSYLEKKFKIFEVIEEKLISKIPENFKEYNDKIEEKGQWNIILRRDIHHYYSLTHSVFQIYETVQNFITSGELCKLIIFKDSGLFKIRCNGSEIAETPNKNLAYKFKEDVDEIITNVDLIGQIKLCMEVDKRMKEKTNKFFLEFCSITDDFEKGHINMKGFCGRCKSWRNELDDLIKQSKTR